MGTPEIGFIFVEDDKFYQLVEKPEEYKGDSDGCVPCVFKDTECNKYPDCEEGIYIEIDPKILDWQKIQDPFSDDDTTYINPENKIYPAEKQTVERWVVQKVNVPAGCRTDNALILFSKGSLPFGQDFSVRWYYEDTNLIDPKLVQASKGLLGKKIMITIQEQETLEQIKARKPKRSDYQEVRPNTEPITDYEGYWRAMEEYERDLEEYGKRNQNK